MTSLPSNAPRPAVPAHRYSALAIGAVVGLGGLFGLYAAADRQTQLDIGRSMAEQVANQTARSTSGVLDTTRQLLQTMSLLAVPPPGAGAVNAQWVKNKLLALKAAHPHIMDLLIVGADGHIRHWTGDGPPPDVSEREYFSHHARTPHSTLHVGDPLRSIVHRDRWFFAVSEALRGSDGTIRHVLVAVIDIEPLRDQIRSPLALPGSSQALLAENGTVFTRLPDHEHHVGKKITRPLELGPEKPSATMLARSQLDGRDRILSFEHLADYPIIAAGSVTIDELLAEWNQRTSLLFVLWLVFSGATLWISQRENRLHRQQQEIINIDPLTGIRNRRAILSTASSTLARSTDRAGQLSLLMIDADHFKQINDQFGHLAGDDVLRQLSQVLRTSIRATDIVGRYGDEEFLVLMPDTRPDGALRVAEKLRQAVADQITQPAPVTISIGIATASDHDGTLDHTLGRADRALYAAKAAGRNCVKVAPDEPAQRCDDRAQSGG